MVFWLTRRKDKVSSWYKQISVVSFSSATVIAIATLYSIGSLVTTPTHYAYAQGSLIGNVSIPINLDVTAIVPINVNIQNAQICLQVAGGSCTQVVLNPTQQTFSPTTVDLSQPTPTITPTSTTTQPSTTTPTTTITSPTTTQQTPTTGTTGTPTTTSPSSTTSPPSTSTSPTQNTQSGSTGSNTGGGSSGGSSGGG